MTATLTVLRHGDTFAPGETPRRIGARTDLPLAPSGEAQARALGAAFARAGARFDRVLVSPLRRARQTAALATAALAGAPLPELCDFLAEIDHGPDEDQPEALVRARIGADALAAWEESLTPPPGWVVDAPARLAAWRALLDSAEGAMLLVTSNGAARFALQSDPGLAQQAAALRSTKLRTAAWGRIVRADGSWRIAEWDKRA